MMIRIVTLNSVTSISTAITVTIVLTRTTTFMMNMIITTVTSYFLGVNMNACDLKEDHYCK